MKHIFITIILALATITLSAKTLVMNHDTGMKLTEELGVYTITGPNGTLILGDLKNSRDILWQMEKCFISTNMGALVNFTIGENKYEVKSDNQGNYIIKVGFGAVKLRQSDVNQFLTYLQTKITKSKVKKAWAVLTE